MKVRGWTTLILMAVLVAAGTAGAQNSGAEFGVFATYIDSDDLDEGVGGGAKLEFNPIDWLSIDARASWIMFDDPDVDMIPLELAALVNIPLADEKIVPYAGVGGGYYIFDADGFDLDDEVGFFPLVGLEIGMERVSFLVEARWLFLESDLDDAEDELGDLDEADVDGVAINAGLLFRI